MPKQVGLASLSAKKWTKEAENRGDYIVHQFPDLETYLAWIDYQSAIRYSPYLQRFLHKSNVADTSAQHRLFVPSERSGEEPVRLRR